MTASEAIHGKRTISTPGSFGQWIIVAVYGMVVFGILPWHEPWRDEAHSWLLARDLSFSGILHQMRYEGYPPLWILLQVPLAKAGLPFASLGILNAICATLAVAVLVFLSPFTLGQKALIAFSDCVFCWYGMVWRCYSLMMLALFLVAAVYPRRHQRPLLYAICVVLLANIHLLAMGVALLLFLGFVIGMARRRSEISFPLNLAGGLIMAAGIFILVFMLRQPPDCRNPGIFPIFQPYASFQLLAGAFDRFRIQSAMAVYTLNGVLFAVLLWDLWKARDAFWLLLLTYLGWSYVFTFKNLGPYYQHVPALTIMMVVACWVARVTRPLPASFELKLQPGRVPFSCRLPLAEAIVFASLAFGLLCVPYWIYQEIRYPFSAGKEAATVLQNVSPDVPIIGYPFEEAENLLPYLPGRKFWSPQTGEFETFYTPSKQFDAFHFTTVHDFFFRHVIPAFPNHLPWLVISHKERLIGIESMGYELVYPQSVPEVWYPLGETYWIYRPAAGS